MARRVPRLRTALQYQNSGRNAYTIRDGLGKIQAMQNDDLKSREHGAMFERLIDFLDAEADRALEASREGDSLRERAPALRWRAIESPKLATGRRPGARRPTVRLPLARSIH